MSGEVVSTEFAGMIREGHDIASIDAHMVVKVPLTRDGIRACKALSGEGIRVNVTLVFSAAQALLAAKAGATYVSPFVGRLDDIGSNGMELIARDRGDLRQLRCSRPKCSWRAAVILFTSIDAARMGADICTCPPALIDSCSTIR